MEATLGRPPRLVITENERGDNNSSNNNNYNNSFDDGASTNNDELVHETEHIHTNQRRDTALPDWFLDTSNRSLVRDVFFTEYKTTPAVDAAWTGNLPACKPGDISNDFRAAAIRRVNFYRAFAGLGPITLNTNISSVCQDGALVLAGLGVLAHTPANTSKCYSSDAYYALSHANIALGMAGPLAVDGYMAEGGAGNYDVGHRRWILCPIQASMGVGSVVPVVPINHAIADVLTVIGKFGPRPVSPVYVAWPSAGYLPYQLMPNSTRFHCSFPNANFSRTAVVVRINGIESNITYEPMAQGYCDNSIVYFASNSSYERVMNDTVYDFEIRNVGVKGSPTALYNFSYQTIVFDPNPPSECNTCL